MRWYQLDGVDMASLVDRTDGIRVIYIVIGDERKTIGLGRKPKKHCESILAKVEELASCALSGRAPGNQTSAWVGSLPDGDKLLKRLVKLGLVCQRKKPTEVEVAKAVVVTISKAIERFENHKRPMVAARSMDKLSECLALLQTYLKGERDIRSVSTGDGLEFESWGRGKGFSEAYQRTVNRYAKQFFAFHVEVGTIEENPFRKLKSTSLSATVRHYVTPEDTIRLLNACPDHKWKVLVGLARYAGLRVPSEAFAITWAHVDWEQKALLIPSKKTRRYADSRPMPIIPELMEILEKAFEDADVGAEKVVELSYANIRRKLPAIIKKAGLKPWEDLFQTLRRSCETHLVSLGHPPHAVSAWLGHSQQVSKDHYLMVTSEHFSKATTVGEKSAEKSAVTDRNEGKRREKSAQSSAVETTSDESLNEKTQVNPGNSLVVRAGIEPATHGFSVRCSTY
jgi:integrase